MRSARLPWRPINFSPQGQLGRHRRAARPHHRRSTWISLREVVAKHIEEMERQNNAEVARVEEHAEAERMHLRGVADQEIEDIKRSLDRETLVAA